MNYTIKSNTGTIVIGLQTFTDTPVNLVSCLCVGNDSERVEFFNNSIQNNFTLFLNGVETNCTPIVSRFIQYSIDGIPTDNHYLNQDLNII